MFRLIRWVRSALALRNTKKTVGVLLEPIIWIPLPLENKGSYRFCLRVFWEGAGAKGKIFLSFPGSTIGRAGSQFERPNQPNPKKIRLSSGHPHSLGEGWLWPSFLPKRGDFYIPT